MKQQFSRGKLKLTFPSITMPGEETTYDANERLSSYPKDMRIKAAPLPETVSRGIGTGKTPRLPVGQ